MRILKRLCPLGLFVLLLPLVNATPVGAYDCSTLPVGQASPTLQTEPMGPIWCSSLVAEPTTGVSDPFGGYVDNFDTNVQMGRLNDHDMGYRIFTTANERSQHFVNNNHWMTDQEGGHSGGTMLRPDRSFRAENGRLVVEGDVAASIHEYLSPGGGFDIWTEIVITDAPQPTMPNGMAGYAGDMFPGHFAYRCILYPDRALGCAYLNDSRLVGNESNYVWKSSTHLQPNSSSGHYGGDVQALPTADQQTWRACNPNQRGDTFCRDRYRIEINKSSVVEYVNSARVLAESGLTGSDQIADRLLNGDVYVYYADWTTPFTSAPVIRYHWDRLAVNPHDAQGRIQGPSTAVTFCAGQAQNSCPATSTPTPATTPSTPTATPRVPPPATFACNLRYAGQRHVGTCAKNTDGSITFRP